MTANPWRGEVEIRLNGKPYVMRPTFETLSRIEHQLGTGIIVLATKLAKGLLTLEELSEIVAQCLHATALDFDIREALVSGELTQAYNATSAMFAKILNGYDD